MASWVGNNIYIVISGGNLASPVEVTAQFKSVTLTPSVDAIETTRGANQQHRSHLPGMNNITMDLTLGISDSDIYPDYLHTNEVYTVVFAPNGNTAGEPLHTQKFFLTGNPFDMSVDLAERIHATSWAPAEAPTVNIFEGGVVS